MGAYRHYGRESRRGNLGCPNCDSTRVVRRPPNQVSPHPGYVCKDCGTVMRARGMAVVYFVVILIGCASASLFVYFVVTDSFKPGYMIKPVTTVICFAYATRQLMRPVPKRVEPADDPNLST